MKVQSGVFKSNWRSPPPFSAASPRTRCRTPPTVPHHGHPMVGTHENLVNELWVIPPSSLKTGNSRKGRRYGTEGMRSDVRGRGD